jgi:hypothetical protein
MNAMVYQNTFALHRIGEDLPNEMTRGAVIHKKFMSITEELIDEVRIKGMIQHAGRPISIDMRESLSSDVCMHPGCCVRKLSKKGHTPHEKAILFSSNSSDELPHNLLVKLIDFTNLDQKVFPIIDQISLMLSKNPGKYPTFEAMFGPTESHLLVEWWKFAEESFKMMLDDLVRYCSNQERIVFLAKFSKTECVYIKFSITSLTITDMYSVTDNKLTDTITHQHQSKIPFLENFIKRIYRFERKYQLSFEIQNLFIQLSKLQIQRKQKVAQKCIEMNFYEVPISKPFLPKLLAKNRMMIALINRLIPTGRSLDPESRNVRLFDWVHYYASKR